MTSPNTIYVTIRQNYGQTVLYPACEKAKAFAALTGRKTILASDVEHINKLGFSIKQDPADAILAIAAHHAAAASRNARVA